MGKNRELRPLREKRQQSSIKTAGEIQPERRDSLSRTKRVLNAALRVWELKQRASWQ